MLSRELTSVIQDPAVASFTAGVLTNATWDFIKGSFKTFAQALRNDTSIGEAFRQLRAISRIGRSCQLVVTDAIRQLDESDRVKVSLDADLLADAIQRFLLGSGSQPSLLGELRAVLLTSSGGQTPSDEDVAIVVAYVLLALAGDCAANEALLHVGLHEVQTAVAGMRQDSERRFSALDERLDAAGVPRAASSDAASGDAPAVVGPTGTGAASARPHFEPAVGIAPSTAERAMNLLGRENEALEARLRAALDDASAQLWEQILGEMRQKNFRRAIEQGALLRAWVEQQGSQLSREAAGRSYLLLARLELLRIAESAENPYDVAAPEELLRKAREAFGDEISDENLARLISLEASLLAYTGNATRALELLGAGGDASLVTVRLLVWIDQQQFKAAADHVRTLALDAKWCEQAVLAYAGAGEFDDARKALEWAVPNDTDHLEKRCRIAFAQGSLVWLSSKPREGTLSPVSLDERERPVAEESLEVVGLIANACLSAQRVTSGLEVAALSLSCGASRLLGKRRDGIAFVELLRGTRPVPIEFAEAAQRGDVEAPHGLASMLREDYPNLLEAHLLAIVLDIEQGAVTPAETLTRLKAAIPLATDDAARDHLARIVVQACAAADDTSSEDHETLCRQLVGAEHDYVKLIAADRWLKQGDVARAEECLAVAHDPSNALVRQVLARIRTRQERLSDASAILLELGKERADPDLLRRGAFLGLRATPPLVAEGIGGLELALQLEPDDVETLQLLASACLRHDLYEQAVGALRALSTAQPENDVWPYNLAVALAKLNEPLNAIAVFDALCAKAGASARAHAARATLLCSIGRPVEAFEKLNGVRAAYWDEPSYVGAYMATAYAANRDREANEAFLRVLALQKEGKAPPDILRPCTLDDLSEFATAEGERRRELQIGLLYGKWPWLAVDRCLRNPPYWGWRIRTQDLDWSNETREACAGLSIYATNSFAAIAGAEGVRVLYPIICAAAGQAVVMDYSALITLHSLGLLPAAVGYFGTVQIPASYRATVLGDTEKLRPHQLSQRTSLEAIDAKMRGGMIGVDNAEAAVVGRLVVDEYGGPAHSALGLIHIKQALEKAGRLTEVQDKEFERICHREPVDAAHTLQVGDRLSAELSTLRTLAASGLLDVVCSAFPDMTISASDQHRLRSEMRGYEYAQRTLQVHEELWQMVTNDSRIISTAAPVLADESAEAERSEDDESEGILAVDALRLAEASRLPLCVDDRVCQNMALRARLHDPAAAFGSDCVLLALLEANLVTQVQAADAFLRLVTWRYRFLVPSFGIWRAILRTRSRHDLLRVGRYLHDAVADPGLFGGMELDVQPPVPMGWKYFQECLDHLVHFVSSLWLDDPKADEGQASALTEMLLSECLPGVPNCLAQYGDSPADTISSMVLRRALLHFLRTDDYAKANRGLRQIAHSLGMSDDQFVAESEDLVEALGESLGEDRESRPPRQARLMRHILAHRDGQVSGRTVQMMVKNGLLKTSPRDPLPAAVVDIVQNPLDARRQANAGPFVVFRADGSSGVVSIFHCLRSVETRVRTAGLAELSRYLVLAEQPVEPATKRLWASLHDTSCNEPEGVGICKELADQLERDWFFNVEGFRQCGKHRVRDGLAECFAIVLRPRLSTLAFLSRLPVHSPAERRAEISERLDRAVREAQSLGELLDAYFWLSGSLPLSGDLSVASAVQRWSGDRVRPEKIWSTIWRWADGKNSPLAVYHACQTCVRTLGHWEGLPASELATRVLGVVNGPVTDDRWRLRCTLARHYCEHLESLASGWNGEIVAAFAWWFAEYVAAIIDSFDTPVQKECRRIVDEHVKLSNELWTIGRSRVAVSPLRYATLFCESLWSTAMLSELADAAQGDSFVLGDHLVDALALALRRTNYLGLRTPGPRDARCYAFEGDTRVLMLRAADRTQDAALAGALSDNVALFGEIDDADRFQAALARLASRDPEVQRQLAHEARLRALAGGFASLDLRTLFSNSEWRNHILVNAESEVVDLIASAAVQMQVFEEEDGAKLAIPHLFAAATAEVPAAENRGRELFAHVVVSSLAVNSVSAVERLLCSKDLGQYREFASRWCERIDRALPHAPPWFASRLRRMKCVLDV